jgi:hypothetical protein
MAPSGCCTAVVGQAVHTFQQYGIGVCMSGCAHRVSGAYTCSTDVCNPV